MALEGVDPQRARAQYRGSSSFVFYRKKMSATDLHPPPAPGPHIPEPLDVRVWMPPFLFLLQMTAHSYADAPTPTLRKKYYQILTDLRLTLPDVRWQAWFAQALDEIPVSAFLLDRQAVFDWVYRVRCRVHQQLRWPPIGYAEHHDAFYRAFRPKPVQEDLTAAHHRMVFMVVAAVLAVFGIVYLSPPRSSSLSPRPLSTMLPFPLENTLQVAADLARDGAATVLELADDAGRLAAGGSG